LLVLFLTISLFVILGLGFYVLVSAPHRRVNRVFAVFNLVMILWVLKDLLFWGFPDAGFSVEAWTRTSFVIAVLLQTTFLLFAEVFPEGEPVRWGRLILYSLPLLGMLPLVMGDLAWQSVQLADGELRIELTWFAILFGLVNYWTLGVGLIRLARKRVRHRGTILEIQINLIVVAVGLTAGLLLFGVNILPLFGRYQLLPYSSGFIVIGALIYTYAISSFRLFWLPTALDQLRLFPLTYKLTIVVTLVGYLGLFFVQFPIARWSLGDNNPDWIRYVVFSSIALMLPSLILVLVIVRVLSRPLRELTELALDVSRGNYGAVSRLTSNDELGVLASSFNTMSQKMADDISRLKEINQAMVRSEKLATAGALATSVAHEVNNPLASISSLVQSLLTTEADERNRETLRTILGQITRITTVLHDLMEFARPKIPDPRLTDINELIRKSIELAMYDKRFRNLRIDTGFGESLPRLKLDGDRLQQVLLNLLLNARDAIAEAGVEGRISITTSIEETTIGSAAVIEVGDNGYGIPKENLPLIFDPFFSTKGKEQGSGLGLAVCLNIVTALGGRIEARNGQPGAVFTITFPLAESGRQL
jgi:signal transduction histidine kinase